MRYTGWTVPSYNQSQQQYGYTANQGYDMNAYPQQGQYGQTSYQGAPQYNQTPYGNDPTVNQPAYYDASASANAGISDRVLKVLTLKVVINLLLTLHQQRNQELNQCKDTCDSDERRVGRWMGSKYLRNHRIMNLFLMPALITECPMNHFRFFHV